MSRTLVNPSYIDAVLVNIPILNNVAGVSAVPPSEYSRFILSNNRREQTFQWKTDGDYTSRVTADVNKGRYIQHPGVSPNGTTGGGCWVAIPHNPTGVPGLNGRFQRDTWHYAEFDVPTDIGDDASPYITALHNLANIDRPGCIQQDNGIFSLYSQIPEFLYQAKMVGVRNGGFQSSITYKRYHEPNATRGVFHSSQWSVQYEDINLQADAALASGGVGFGLVTTLNDAGSGDAYLNRCRASMGDGVNYTVLIDGLSNANSDHGAAGGNRHINMTDCIWFGAAIGAVRIAAGRQIMASNIVISTAGGSGGLALAGTGTIYVPSDNVFIHGAISGDIALDHLTRGHFLSYKQGNLSNTANTKRTIMVGPNIAGSTQNNWVEGSAFIAS